MRPTIRLGLCGWVMCGCVEDPPEIWFDRSPIDLGVVSAGTTTDFALQIANDGGGTLVLQPFSLRGDDDCAFFLEGPDILELSGIDRAFIRGAFTPTRGGIHEVAIYLTSNAADLPYVIVPICALVDDGVSKLDELDLVCREPAPDAGNCVL